MKKNKKKSLLRRCFSDKAFRAKVVCTVIALALLASLAVTQTLMSFSTKTDSVTNKVELAGAIQTELRETGAYIDSPAYPVVFPSPSGFDEGLSYSTTGLTYTGLVPGQVIAKAPYIVRTDTDGPDTYAAAVVAVPDGYSVTWNTTDWMVKQVDGTSVYTSVYVAFYVGASGALCVLPAAQSSSESATPAIFTEVTAPSFTNADDLEAYALSSASELTVQAYLVQSENNTYTLEEDAFSTVFPDYLTDITLTAIP